MQPINLSDYEALAEQRMAHVPRAWDYYQGGSDDEVSLRALLSPMELLGLLSPTTAVASSIVSLQALKPCPKWSKPLLAN